MLSAEFDRSGATQAPGVEGGNRGGVSFRSLKSVLIEMLASWFSPFFPAGGWFESRQSSPIRMLGGRNFAK